MKNIFYTKGGIEIKVPNKIFLYDEDLIEVQKHWKELSEKDRFKINYRIPYVLFIMTNLLSFAIILTLLAIQLGINLINCIK